MRRGGGHRHHEGMAWTLTEDLDDYYAAGDFVASHPVQNTIQLTAAETVRSRGRSAFGPSAPLFGWWSQGGRGTAALLHTPPYPVLLTSLPGDGAESLAVALAGRLLPGVNAAESDSVAFAAAWSKNTGMGWRVFRRSRLFRLTELVSPEPRPAGTARGRGKQRSGDRPGMVRRIR